MLRPIRPCYTNLSSFYNVALQARQLHRSVMWRILWQRALTDLIPGDDSEPSL